MRHATLAMVALTGCPADVLLVPDGGELRLLVGRDSAEVGSAVVGEVCAFRADGRPVPDGTLVTISAPGAVVECGKDAPAAPTETGVPSDGLERLTVSNGCAFFTMRIIEAGRLEVRAWSGSVSSEIESLEALDLPMVLSVAVAPTELPAGGGAVVVSGSLAYGNGSPVGDAFVQLALDPAPALAPAEWYRTTAEGTVEMTLAISVTTNITLSTVDPVPVDFSTSVTVELQ